MSTSGHREGAVVARDGVEVRYKQAGHGAPSLVWIQGWLCASADWRHSFQHFSRTHHVVTLDFGGQGEDTGVDRRDWSFDNLAHDVKSVADALKLNDIVLIGHSMGAAIALEAERIMVGRVRGVIAVESLTYPEFYDRASPERIEALVADFRVDLPGLVRKTMAGYRIANERRPEVDEAIETMAGADPEMACGTLRSFLQWDVTEALSRCTVPVTCINAEAFLSPAEEARWRDRLQIRKLRNTGHFPMLEILSEFQGAIQAALTQLKIP